MIPKPGKPSKFRPLGIPSIADVIIVREGSKILVLYSYNFVKFLLTGL